MLAARALALLAGLACGQVPQPHQSGRRLSLSLDGATGWTLTLDPTDPRTKRIAAAGNKTAGPIPVPSAWQA